MNKHFNKVIGNYGEKLAQDYLKKHHFKILETNYSTHIGEIDIIAKIHKTIVFVEVKCRSSEAFGSPREAVTPYKQNKIRLVAEQYMQANKLMNALVRFDVIEICSDNIINHIENCF